ncbi:MAG: SPFH domain-containing protein [Gemmatimonadaceae bacterium]|nr:SPFH domain-containing protein [Gemmatimonadaceae bacterium]
MAELILWDPGETVVLLKNKRLIPMDDPFGGYKYISPWRGEEFKGRLSHKLQMSKWTSDSIFTSDGLSVNLVVGIWWRIADANRYVAAIATSPTPESRTDADALDDNAKQWIEMLAGSTLREQVNKLPTDKLISPYVRAYIQVKDGMQTEAVPQFSELLNFARDQLDAKTQKYGIETDRLEVQELVLTKEYKQKLENVRAAFLAPDESRALTEARMIALRELSSVIGSDRVGLIEILKVMKVPDVMLSSVAGGLGALNTQGAVDAEVAKMLSASHNSVPAAPGPPKALGSQ